MVFQGPWNRVRSEEAEATAEVIDFEKWSVLSNEYETVVVVKEYFLRKIKVEQDKEPVPDIDGPALKIVN